tara:strand:+ start:9808 stop:11325 length:1518 start_codon:yes stop_codon:yes gene_type:complete
MGILDGLLNDINKAKQMQLNRDERKAERELTLLLTEMKMNFEREENIDRHNADMTERYSASNLTKSPSGRYVLKDNYDPSDVPSEIAKRASIDYQALRDRGLPATDDEELNRLTISMYDKGQKAGLSFSRVSLSNQELSPFMIDVSPTGLTSDDFNQFRLVYQSAGGAESTEMLEYLINDLGIIDRADVFEDNVGRPTIYGPDGIKDNTKAALIDNALIGFKSGLRDNEEFMTSFEYDKRAKDDAMFGINYANAIAQSIPSQQAEKKLLDRGKVFWSGLQPQILEGERVVMWDNELIKLKDVTDEITHKRGHFKGLSDSESKILSNRMDQFAQITQDGTGFQLLVEELLSQPDQGASELALISKYISPSLAKTIMSGVQEWSRVSRVGQAALKYYKDPESIEEVRMKDDRLQGLLVQTGIKQDLIKLRHIPEGSSEYKELDDLLLQKITKMAKSLMKEGGAQPYLDENGNTAYTWDSPEAEARYNQLFDWLELEDATFKFNKGVN